MKRLLLAGGAFRGRTVLLQVDDGQIPPVRSSQGAAGGGVTQSVREVVAVASTLIPREAVRSIPVEKRKHNFDEVELSWNENVAQRQAKRCLRCDYGKTVTRRGSKK